MVHSGSTSRLRWRISAALCWDGGARRLKAGMEGAVRLLAQTQRAQWLQAGTEEVGVAPRCDRKTLADSGWRKFGCSKTGTVGALRLLSGKEGCQRLGKG